MISKTITIGSFKKSVNSLGESSMSSCYITLGLYGYFKSHFNENNIHLHKSLHCFVSYYIMLFVQISLIGVCIQRLC